MKQHGICQPSNPLSLFVRLASPACVTFVCLGLASTASAELTATKLQELARTAVQNGEVDVFEPRMQVENGRLEYSLGGADYVPERGSMNFEPFDYAMGSQLQVEVIRQFRPRAEQRTLWEPIFVMVEPLIAQQLTVAQKSSLSDTEKRRQLGELRNSINQSYDDGMQRHASAQGLKAQRVGFGAAPALIKIATRPSGGRVSLMSTFEFKTAKAMGRKPRWCPISRPDYVMLDGNYWYRATFGSRAVVGSKPIRVTRPGKFTFDSNGSYIFTPSSK